MIGLAASVLVIGTLVTGSGPHGGDTRADRLGFDLTPITRIHSTSAWFLVTATLLLAWSLRPLGGPGAGARQANLTRLLVALVVQGAIGYWQFATGIPPALVELHVMGAIAVWSTALWMHLGLFDRGPLDIAVEGTRS
jgi:heme a synthase